MPQAVLEEVAVAGVGDDLDGQVLDVGAYAAGLCRGGAGLVGLAHDVIDVALLVGGLAHADGAGHVALVVVVAGAVVHDDHVAPLDHGLAGLGMRVGAVCAGGDDGAKGQGVGAVVEHVVLELHADLLLGHAGLYEAADVRERGVRDGLGVTHELDLLGVLDHAQVADVAVHARGEAGNGELAHGLVEGIEEGKVAGVLDGHDARAGGAGALGGPGGGAHDFFIDDPGGVGAQALAEGVGVAGVRVEPLAVGRHEGGVGDLVVKGALRPGEPAQVGVVAQDHGVVAALRHEGAQALDAPRACLGICHVLLLCSRARGDKDSPAAARMVTD